MASINRPKQAPRAGAAVRDGTAPSLGPACQQDGSRASSDVAAATEQREVIAILRSSGSRAIADRLGYLHSLAVDDPDEKPIAFESLRRLALFVMGKLRLPDPEIGVSPEGFAQAEWRVGDDGVLAMEFLPADVIRFAAVSHAAGRGTQRLSVNGVLPTADALDAVQVFTDRLTSQ